MKQLSVKNNLAYNPQKIRALFQNFLGNTPIANVKFSRELGNIKDVVMKEFSRGESLDPTRICSRCARFYV